jgi:hypothetical protein
MNRRACVLFALGSAHCAHVTIPVAPPITAPFSERAAYFQQFRTRTRVRQVDPRAVIDTPMTIGLELRNGLYVTRPSDLLPAIDPASRTAELGRASAQRERVANGLRAGGYGAIAAGGLFVLLGYAITRRADTAVTGVGVGVAVIGFTLGFSSEFVDRPPREELQECFEGYDAALQQRLGIAVRRRQREAEDPPDDAPR